MEQPSQFTITTIIAVWGAVLGTLTFFWNVLKWRQESPQISACVEAVESFSKDDCYSGIRLKIRNRGGKKTTVENIFLFSQPSWARFVPRRVAWSLSPESCWERNIAASHLKSAVLPVVLDINGVWSGFIPFEANDEDDEEELRDADKSRDLAKALRIGKVRYSIVCSHTNTRKNGVIGREDF